MHNHLIYRQSYDSKPFTSQTPLNYLIINTFKEL
jgi:hypothetical protein